MEDKTTDRFIVKFHLATLIPIIAFIIGSTAYVVRTLDKIETIEQSHKKDIEMVYERIDNVDSRITKTTGRNSEAIKKLQE